MHACSKMGAEINGMAKHLGKRLTLLSRSMPTHVCPICKQSFDTNKAYGVHASKQHKIAGARWLQKRRPAAGKGIKRAKVQPGCNKPQASALVQTCTAHHSYLQ